MRRFLQAIAPPAQFLQFCGVVFLVILACHLVVATASARPVSKGTAVRLAHARAAHVTSRAYRLVVPHIHAGCSTGHVFYNCWAYGTAITPFTSARPHWPIHRTRTGVQTCGYGVISVNRRNGRVFGPTVVRCFTKVVFGPWKVGFRLPDPQPI